MFGGAILGGGLNVGGAIGRGGRGIPFGNIGGGGRGLPSGPNIIVPGGGGRKPGGNIGGIPATGPCIGTEP